MNNDLADERRSSRVGYELLWKIKKKTEEIKMDALKILVVDDEERMARFIRLNLEHDGFQVIEAYKGMQAVQMMRDALPDLVLLDANPIADIANTRRIDTVILGGKVYGRAALDAMIQSQRVDRPK